MFATLDLFYIQFIKICRIFSTFFFLFFFFTVKYKLFEGRTFVLKLCASIKKQNPLGVGDPVSSSLSLMVSDVGSKCSDFAINQHIGQDFTFNEKNPRVSKLIYADFLKENFYNII